MKGIFTLFVFFCFLYLPQKANATSITATQSGNWNQTDTWGGNAVPDGTPCYDTIIIPPSITVTITATVDLTGCPPVVIIVEGNLAFQNGRRLHLPDGSVVFIEPGGTLNNGGGGGNSTLITIDGDNYWSAGCTGSPPPNCGVIAGPGVICQNCALPIELLSFNADLGDGLVYLTWETASETENDYFWVQRSTDGFTWENILWHDGAGNSSSLISYMMEDRQPLLGLSYYRLKQTDMNGAFSFSDVKVVSNGQFHTDQELLVISSSNGVGNQVVVYFSEPIEGNAEIMIAGLSGAVILAETIKLDSEQWVVLTINRSLASGIYVVKSNQLIEKVFFE